VGNQRLLKGDMQAETLGQVRYLDRTESTVKAPRRIGSIGRMRRSGIDCLRTMQRIWGDLGMGDPVSRRRMGRKKWLKHRTSYMSCTYCGHHLEWRCSKEVDCRKRAEVYLTGFRYLTGSTFEEAYTYRTKKSVFR